MVAKKLDPKTRTGCGSGDAVGDLRPLVRFDHDHRGDVRIRTRADQRSEWRSRSAPNCSRP
jgi:hypothetical protein